MKPSTELFELIKSLTKSEKRFFKLTSSIQSGRKNYFKLFDFIDKQKEYDEAELKKFFKNETFIKHLPSEKNHLYKLILKSLRQFYGESSAGSIIQQEIKNIEILYNKALYFKAKKFIKRAKNFAHEHEEFYYLTDLLSWEKILIEESYESGDFDVDLNKIVEEESLVIDKLRNLAEYQILYSKINAIFRSDGFTKNEEQREMVDEIANHPLIKGENTALSVRASTTCYYIQGLCAATKRDYETSYIKFKKVKQKLDKNPKIKEDLAQRYILTLFHLIQSYSLDREFGEAQKQIDLIKKLKDTKGFNSLNLTLRINNILLTEQMALYVRQGNFDKALKTLEDNYENNKSLIERSSKEQKMKFFYAGAYTLFAHRDFKESLRFINLILNDNKHQLRRDIYIAARILDLMIHFELGNYDYLEYSSNAALRNIKKDKRDHEIEKTFIKRIKKSAKEATHITAIQTHEKTLTEVKKLLENEEEQAILDYLNIVAWIESKITGESFINLSKKSILERNRKKQEEKAKAKTSPRT